MSAYYNENDPAMAAWLAELMARGLIAKGHIDTRSITEVQPSDLNGFTQCHFFAGIGGWSAALRLAGWADDRPIWTGSCPCQPFSVAGKGRGKKDPRHLWPQFRRLIRQCRPATVFGEQVASADGRVWLSGVFADLEALAYRAAGADLCAAGVGAPHIRQRLYWVADAERDTRGPRWIADESREGIGEAGERTSVESGRCGDACRLGDASGDNERRSPMPGEHGQGVEAGGSGGAGRLADPKGTRSSHGREGAIQSLAGECGGEAGWMVQSGQSGLEGHAGNGDDRNQPGRIDAQPSGPTPAPSGLGAWSDFRIVHCLDGKARRIGSGIQPLAHGISGRVAVVRPAFGSQPASPEEIRWVNRRAALQGAGNAIVPQLAAEFIAAFDDVLAAADADRAPAVAGV